MILANFFGTKKFEMILNNWYPYLCLGDRLMVGLRPLKAAIGVRIPVPQHFDKLSALHHNNDMVWFVYILLCDERKFYVGMTDNLERRIKQHKKKQSFYTKQFSSVELVYTEKYKTRKDVERREIQLKGWSVAKKKALIEGNKSLLVKLSKSIRIGEASVDQ